jgi:hypothetical protein
MVTEKALLQSFVGSLPWCRYLPVWVVCWTTHACSVVSEMAVDSHFRYLSGLLLGIGVSFMWAIPHIELLGQHFRLLTAIVVGAALMGTIVLPMFLALVMELAVTPALCLWQHRVALKFAV